MVVSPLSAKCRAPFVGSAGKRCLAKKECIVSEGREVEVGPCRRSCKLPVFSHSSRLPTQSDGVEGFARNSLSGRLVKSGVVAISECAVRVDCPARTPFPANLPLRHS